MNIFIVLLNCILIIRHYNIVIIVWILAYLWKYPICCTVIFL